MFQLPLHFILIMLSNSIDLKILWGNAWSDFTEQQYF